MTDLGHFASFTLFALGRRTITLGGLIAGLAMVVVFAVVARIAGAAVARLRRRAVHTAGALYIVEKLVRYGLTLFGLTVGLSTVGIDLSSLAVFAGAVGVGVGLGLQDIVKEFVAGLVLIFDRIMSVGDFVELDDGKRGVVQEIGPRAVRIRTNDNVDLAIPNSKFISGPVVNWTLNNQTRRIHIPFSVAYGSDRQKVRDAVLAAARSVPFTSPETETKRSQVWLTSFGDSALEFELLVWPTVEAAKRPASMQAAYTWAIADALEAAGIEVPFPQMDVRLRSLFGREGDEALAAAGLSATPEPPRRGPQRPSVNDAADELCRPPADEAADRSA